MSSIAQVAAPYRAILCDIWGVVHDGARLLPGAAERLLAWKADGKRIILLTNAPRPASTVQRDLDRIGLPRAAYDAITSSGEAGIAALVDPPREVGFLGTADDRADLLAHGVSLIDDGFTEVACTGLDEWRDDPGDYRALLHGRKILPGDGAAVDVLLEAETFATGQRGEFDDDVAELAVAARLFLVAAALGHLAAD